MKAINLNIKGIKCDNPSCDFRNDTVEYQDYKDWLNKPCPQCGANLLTQKDLITIRRLIKITNTLNWFIKPFIKPSQPTKVATLILKMDGTGKIDAKLKDS